jgi:hypothetical protein
MLRRGAEKMVTLIKSFIFCSEGIPLGKYAPEGDLKIDHCTLLSMNNYFQLRNIS